MHSMSIGKLAKAAGVSVDTIRFYEKSGVLAAPIRKPSGFREYSERDLDCLRFVRRARGLGFSIPHIQQILSLDLEAVSEQTTAILKSHIQTVDRKIAELQRWRALFQRCTEPMPSRPHVPSSIVELFHSDANDIEFDFDHSSTLLRENRHEH